VDVLRVAGSGLRHCFLQQSDQRYREGGRELALGDERGFVDGELPAAARDAWAVPAGTSPSASCGAASSRSKASIASTNAGPANAWSKAGRESVRAGKLDTVTGH
jgi:hypothetical protein